MRAIDADKLKRKAQECATEAWKMNLTARIETVLNQFIDWIDEAPTVEPEIIRCKDCKYWKQQTNYQSFGFCENNDIWTYTDGDHYCGYVERR